MYIIGLVVRVVLKVRKKGVMILPKRLREVLGVDEGGEVIAEVVGDKLVLRALKPRVVDIDPEFVEELLREEYKLEKNRYTETAADEKTSSRH
jgi:AbrB family looped-hinge helix DNA binding protein